MSLRALQSRLGYQFAQPQLLEQALTHRSFSADHNERLEFLGDSILNMVVAQLLFAHFPHLREGQLSRLRAQWVKQDSLQQIAERLQLGNYLRLGEGELKSGGGARPSILADATEAIFGAIFVDAGFEPVQRVIAALYQAFLSAHDPTRSLKDPKTQLQEFLQAKRLALPSYELVTVRGQAHAQEFEMRCVIDALAVSTVGCGVSRRAAEQMAAQNALVELDVVL